jgi:hypothetical protein
LPTNLIDHIHDPILGAFSLDGKRHFIHDPKTGSIMRRRGVLITTSGAMEERMRRVKILKKGLSPAEVKGMEALAIAAGFKTDEIEVVASVSEPDVACDDEIILVLASPAICADPELESALAAAQRGGRRAICVWPEEGAATLEPPAAAKNYAYSIIRWDAKKLRVVAADDDELCFETPDGQTLPAPKTERNLCVDEKAKPK